MDRFSLNEMKQKEEKYDFYEIPWRVTPDGWMRIAHCEKYWLDINQADGSQRLVDKVTNEILVS